MSIKIQCDACEWTGGDARLFVPLDCNFSDLHWHNQDDVYFHLCNQCYAELKEIRARGSSPLPPVKIEQVEIEPIYPVYPTEQKYGILASLLPERLRWWFFRGNVFKGNI